MPCYDHEAAIESENRAKEYVRLRERVDVLARVARELKEVALNALGAQYSTENLQERLHQLGQRVGPETLNWVKEHIKHDKERS